MVDRTSESGFALLLAIILSSILLAVGLTILSITIKQLSLSSIGRESEVSFHAASAAMECIRWQRSRNPGNRFTDRVSGTRIAPQVAESFNCMTNPPVSGSNLHWSEGTGAEYLNSFTYRYNWGAPLPRCSEIELYVMQASDTAFDYDFEAAGISSAVGDKTCPANGRCTVAITRGYNKSCADLDVGLATIEREITAQF